MLNIVKRRYISKCIDCKYCHLTISLHYNQSYIQKYYKKDNLQ